MPETSSPARAIMTMGLRAAKGQSHNYGKGIFPHVPKFGIRILGAVFRLHVFPPLLLAKPTVR